jgi:hypothetical protein
MKRVSSMWRNADDTLRARIWDRARESDRNSRDRNSRYYIARDSFDIDFFDRSERDVFRKKDGKLQAVFGVWSYATESGDVFHNRKDAAAFIRQEFGGAALPMKTPPDRYTQGWDDNLEAEESCPGHYRDNQGWCHGCGLYLGMDG